MRLRDYATTLATYNRWMNDRLYAVAATLSEAERQQDRGAFFGSLHGILNHLFITDEAWLQRFRGETVTMRSPREARFSDFAALHTARQALDAAIAAWAAALDEAQAEHEFRFYSYTYGRERVLPFWAAVAHFFNHQAHHRGQATTLLSQCGREVGVTDLPWMPAWD